MKKFIFTLAGVVLALGASVALTTGQDPTPTAGEKPPVKWAIALHGGAGKPPEGLPPEKIATFKKEVLANLENALKTGRDMLADGKSALDAVEAVVRVMEDDPNLNAGRGSVMNIAGGFEMHASIMDGKTRDCGAVAAINEVRNPISLARKVMEETEYIILVGDGAEAFAKEMKADMVQPKYFRTELRYNNWIEARKDLGLPVPGEKPAGMGRVPDRDLNPEEMIGTVGCVAMDEDGNLAAATSTGGVSHKRVGRMGDSSIIGAGNFADNRTCAVSCTGIGEHFIRNSVAFHLSALMRYEELTVKEAASTMVDDVLLEGTGGLIAIDKEGNIAMDYNRDGMRRAAADSNGTYIVEYWE